MIGIGSYHSIVHGMGQVGRGREGQQRLLLLLLLLLLR